MTGAWSLYPVTLRGVNLSVIVIMMTALWFYIYNFLTALFVFITDVVTYVYVINVRYHLFFILFSFAILEYQKLLNYVWNENPSVKNNNFS